MMYLKYSKIAFNKNKELYKNRETLEKLRNKISQIENNNKSNNDKIISQTPIIPLGERRIDSSLPWGDFPKVGLHEIVGDTSAVGFAATIINKISSQNINKTILWCQSRRNLYCHGLLQFGISPDRIIFVHSKNDTEILWAMEEGLQNPDLSIVVGRPYKVPSIAGRRLQLAAEANNSLALLINPQTDKSNQLHTNTVNAALTRWHVKSASSLNTQYHNKPSFPKWDLELQRYKYSSINLNKQKIRKSQETSWQVEWCHETHNISLVANLCNGSTQSNKNQSKIQNNG